MLKTVDVPRSRGATEYAEGLLPGFLSGPAGSDTGVRAACPLP